MSAPESRALASSMATLERDLPTTAEPPVVRVRELGQRIGKRVLLKGIHFDVAPRQIFGIIGAVGAGKTPLARLLAGVEPPQMGSVEIAGHRTDLEPELARKRLGYLPHPPVAFPQLSVLEHLEFFRRVSGLEEPERVDAVLERTRLTHRKHELVDQLNEGQRQRLGLARALLHDPAVLILDEPMTNVDPMRRDALSALLLELKKDGKALLVLSPLVTGLAELCDRIAILHAGRLLAQGTLDDVVEQSGAKTVRSGLAALQDRLSLDNALEDRRSYLDAPTDGRSRRSSEPPADVQGLRLRCLGDPAAIPPLLSALPRVAKVQILPDGSLLIHYVGDESFAADLVRCLVEQDVDILSLEPQHGELERVFRSLTQGPR